MPGPHVDVHAVGVLAHAGHFVAADDPRAEGPGPLLQQPLRVVLAGLALAAFRHAGRGQVSGQ